MRTDLKELVREAVARFEALSPEDKRKHREAQRRSWVVGNMLLDNPAMTREQAEGIYERVR